MKKDISKSHSLKRRLLIALITCLLTVMIICTALFEAVFRKTTDTVDEHFDKLTGIAAEGITDTLCADDLEAMRAVLKCYCREATREMEQGFVGSTEEDAAYYLLNRAPSYFSEVVIPSNVLFVIDENDILMSVCADPFSDELIPDDIMQDAFAAMDSMEDKWFEGRFEDYLHENQGFSDACYTKEGDGYIIVWENMADYSSHHQCVGLVYSG